jgi:transcriptional regulator with XRE-family HTH domain
MSTIGNHLRSLRNRAGLTQTQLAAAIGLSGNSLISRIESGSVSPTPGVLNSLAKFYNQDLEALIAMTTAESQTHGVLHGELAAMADESSRARDRLNASVDQLLGEFDQHQRALTNFMMASKLNLVWSLPRKLKRERQAKSVWVLSPELESETNVPGIRATVGGNIGRGVEYRYLIPDREPVLERAQGLMKEFADGPLKIRVAPTSLFDFTIETVIYDPGSKRRLSLMVAPTRRPEFDIVLGSDAADRFEESFSTWWETARAVSL